MKEIKTNIVILLGVAFICLGSTNACAQKSSSSATTEDIAIAFYRTGDVVPNFDRWIRKTEPYIHTPAAIRPKIYDREMERLLTAYYNFNPQKHSIVIKTSSYIKPSEEEDYNGNKTYSLNAKFAEAPDAIYFPYDFLDERIVVLPYSVEKIMNSNITADQYKYMVDTRAKDEKLTTVIRMQPFEADFSKPYEIDGLEQWAFKTKIASIEFWNSQSNLIWEYTAPWYTSPHIRDIKKLYKDRPADSNFKKGTVKATPAFNK